MQVHDLSGELLMFIVQTGQFPATLGDLVAGSTNPNLKTTCPVSGEPYVYRNPPIELAERGLFVLLHDPKPSHDHQRWAITYRPAEAGKAPVTEVKLLQNQFFLLQR